MKRTILLVALLLTAGLLFAEGQRESWENPWVEDELTISGEFTYLTGFPALETEEGTYLLMAPGARRLALGIDEGTQMEITGFLLSEEGGRGSWMTDIEGAESSLRVTEASFDGETYEVSPPGTRRDGWGPGMMGRTGGRGFEGGPGFGDPGPRGDGGGRGYGGPGPRGGYGGRGSYGGRGGCWSGPGSTGGSRF